MSEKAFLEYLLLWWLFISWSSDWTKFSNSDTSRVVLQLFQISTSAILCNLAADINKCQHVYQTKWIEIAWTLFTCD